jgi:hypothetical protein
MNLSAKCKINKINREALKAKIISNELEPPRSP